MTATLSPTQAPVLPGSLEPSFEWTRSETLALASQHCVHCHGIGLRSVRDTNQPCYCVFRKIFNICFARFRRCVDRGRVSISAAYQDESTCSPAHGRRHKYGFRNEEFMADFLHIAKTALNDKPVLYAVFRLHYLYGADFKRVNQVLGRRVWDRNTFHDFYRIEHAVGRAFRETRPYGIFPLDEYFGGAVRGKVIPFPAWLSD